MNIEQAVKNALFFVRENGFSTAVLPDNRRLYLDLSLLIISKMVQPGTVLKTHRAYLVKISEIRALRFYRNQVFALVGDHQVPVSRRKRDEIIRSLQLI